MSFSPYRPCTIRVGRFLHHHFPSSSTLQPQLRLFQGELPVRSIGTSIKKSVDKYDIAARSGSAWSDKELNFFKISIHGEPNFTSFFQQEPMDISVMSPSIQEIMDATVDFETVRMTDWMHFKHMETPRFIKHVLSITQTRTNLEAMVDDFARFLLELFKYDQDDLAIIRGEPLQLDMCGSKKNANPNIVIKDVENQVKLLVQEDKSHDASQKSSPEAQLIAEAIASFQRNAEIKAKDLYQPYKSHVFPCIAMKGTNPVFYLFRVTEELAKAVQQGVKPNEASYVQRYVIPKMGSHVGSLMAGKMGRLRAFQCYAAFKKFVVSPIITT